MTRKKFLEHALDGFAKLKKELQEDMDERDLRDSFVRAIVREVLGWEKGEEQGRYRVAEERDITLFDDKDFPVAIIETKAPSESVKRKDFKNTLENRLRQYGSEYGVLVNGHRLILYKFDLDSGMEELSQIDIDRVAEKDTIGLSKGTEDSILSLIKIKRTRLLKITDTKYLSERHRVIDVSTDEGFDQLIDKIRVSLDEVMGAVRKFFDFYSKDDHPQAEFFKKAYADWCSISNRDKESEDSIETFCRETAYVILNRVLFTRILDDKELIAKAISGKGLATSYSRRKKREKPWLEIFNGACEDAKEYYEHFYMLGMFDWWKIEETKRELLDRQEESELKDCETKLNQAVGESLRLLNPFNFRFVDRDIYGHIYQQYLPPEERKELGEFYTPIKVVKYILDLVGFKAKNKIEDKHILDLACGSGTFLVEAVNRILQKYRKKGLDLDKPEDAKLALEGIIEHIHGLDINPFACHIAETNLLFQVIDLYESVRRTDKYKDYTLPRFNIYSTDSLIPSERGTRLSLHDFEQFNSRAKRFIEEEKEANKLKNRKFDFVVGNPPYVRKEHIPPSYKKRILEPNYSEVYHGDNDICAYFIAKGIERMNEEGKFGYIVSGKFMKTRYGKYLRASISLNSSIEKLLDLRGSKVFEEATNDPIILTLSKGKKEDNKFGYAKTVKDMAGSDPDERMSKMFNHIENHWQEIYSDEYIQTFPIAQAQIEDSITKKDDQKFESSEWLLIPAESFQILKKVEEVSDSLLEGISEVYFGIKKLASEHVVSEEQINEYNLERELLKPVLEGKDVRRYRANFSDKYLYFPYREDAGEYKLLEEEKIQNDYPNLYAYLEKSKDKLENLYDLKTADLPWYALRPCGYYDVFGDDKIVTPDISSKSNFALDEEGYLSLHTLYFIKPEEEPFKEFGMPNRYLLGLLNSNLIEFYLKNISSYLGKRGYRFQKQYLERIPIRLPENSQKQKKANSIQNIVKKIRKLVDQLKQVEGRIETFPSKYEIGKSDKLAWLTDVQELGDDSYKTSRARYEKYQDLEEETKYKFILKRGHYVILDTEEQAEFLTKLLENGKRITREEFLELKIPSEEEMHRVMREFREDRRRIKEINEEVEELEGEINNLVYDLYGLDEDEIETIEDFLEIS